MTGPSIVAFPGFVVRPEWAPHVATGAFDAFTPEERQRVAAEQPHSFINVTRSPSDYVPGLAPPMDEMLTEGRVALDRLLASGVFGGDGSDRLFCYRLQRADHTQLGVVGLVSVDSYLDDEILRHEEVSPDRVALLARHIEVVRATSSPVALTYRYHETISEVTERTSATEPLLDLVGADGLRQTVWTIAGDDVEVVQGALTERTLYVTDGHHRLAAAAAVRGRSEDDHAGWTLASLFPADELSVLSFHRRAVGPLAAPVADLLGAMRNVGDLEGPLETMPDTHRPEIVGCYIGQRWYRFELPAVGIDTEPAGRLAATRIQSAVLGPVFGIDRPTDSDRVEYVAAPLGVAELCRRCDADGGAGFVLAAPTVDEILAVADSRGRTPPKASYFDPKPRVGVFLRLLDGHDRDRALANATLPVPEG